MIKSLFNQVMFALVAVTGLLGSASAKEQQRFERQKAVRAGHFTGTWESAAEIDGKSVSYKVIFSEGNSKLYGIWAIEGDLPATGCLKGTARKAPAVLSMCTMDGSQGAQNNKSVCPNFATNENRFAIEGDTLVWQTRAQAAKDWRTFGVLTRAERPQPFEWPSDCGAKK